MLAGNRMFIRIKCMMIDFMEREVVYERFVKGDEKCLSERVAASGHKE